jgi:heat shock protein HslJ
MRLKHHHKKKISWIIEGAVIACIIVIIFEGISYLLSRITPSEVTGEPIVTQTIKQPSRLKFVQSSIVEDTFPQSTSTTVIASSSSLIIATATKPVDINMLSLTMKPWVWVRTIDIDGTSIYPKKEDAYTATFGFQDTVQLGAGCKTGFGLYSLSQNILSIHDIIISEKNCIDATETIDAYLRSFDNVTTYTFNTRGELVLRTKGLRGAMFFK